MSVQNVQQNPQDVSNIYLKNIQQLLTDANQTISLSSPPLKHKPPTNAVWVNSLWFLSLAINLACSVLANLLQQWARRYIRATQPRYNPKKRARTRAYYASGVEKFRLPLVFEALPAMLHLSVFLFATGLVVFLWNIDPILSKVVLVWLGICLILYFFFTLCPLRYHNSPYDTPFSMPVWYLWTRIHFLIVWNLRQFTCFSASSRLQSLERKYRQFSRQSFFTTTNQTALNSPIEINVAFLNDLDDDGMEHFFTDLPMFHDDLTQKEKPKQLKAFTAFLDSTFSSNFLSEHSKERRAIIYGKTLDPADLPDAYRSILDGVVSSGDYHHKGLISAEFGRFIRGWSGGGGLGEDAEGPFIVQAIYSGIIARAPRNDSWFAFASEELGVSEAVLRDYAAHGHNLSLAILIHLVRQQFNHIGNSLWPAAEFSKLLEAASKFKVRKTSPALQHEFCALWNLVVLKARPDNNWTIGSNILGHIRGIYASLHPDAMDSQSPLFAYNEASYPTCTVPDHIPSTAAPASTLLRDKGALVSVSLTGPDMLFSPILSQVKFRHATTKYLFQDHPTLLAKSKHCALLILQLEGQVALTPLSPSTPWHLRPLPLLSQWPQSPLPVPSSLNKSQAATLLRMT